MTIAEAMAAMYKDKLTCKRTETTIDANGISRESERVIYSAVPCRLSKTSGGVPDHATAPISAQAYTVFTAREVRLKPNDKLTVTHEGEVTVGRCERSMIYDTGCETRMTVKELASQ